MLYVIACLVALCAYLIGSISGAILISKATHGEDIRNSGSKNPGTTNMLRVYGKKLAIFTLLVDVLKGVIAVLIGVIIDSIIKESPTFSPFETNYLLGSMKYIAAIFSVLGHDFPLYFKFKGGKGVATSLGAILMLDWVTGLIVLVAALTIMIVSKYVSLGSVAAAVIYPCITVAFMIGKNDFNIVYFVMSLILAVLLIAKHHANIKRLKNGTENKLFSKKEKVENNG